MLYHEVAVSHPSKRGRVVSQKELQTIWQRHHKEAIYYSTYAFDERGKAHVERHGALKAPIDFPLHVRYIWIDIDGKDAFDAVKRAERALTILHHHGVQPIVWFSGRKGFHLQMGNVFGIEPSPDAPHQVAVRVRQLLGDLVDMAPLRSAASLIRMPYTRHPVTGYWKMPVATLADFRPEHYNKLKIQPLPDLADQEGLLRDLEISRPQEPASQASVPQVPITVDGALSSNVPFLCTMRMLQQGPIQGTRHQTLLRMASAWKRLGLPEPYAMVLARAWLGGEWDEEWERIVKNTYERSYHYSCQDELMQRYCTSRCSLYRMRASNVLSADSLLAELKTMQQMERQAVNLRSVIGVDFRLLPGSLVIITGDTGIGKSALAQTLAVKLGLQTLYLNTEVAQAMMARRFAQIAYQMSAGDVVRRIDELDPKRLAHIDMVTAHPTTSALTQILQRKPYELIVVDTTDDVVVEGVRSEADRLKAVIELLRDVATRTGAIVLAVHHINKEAAKQGRINLSSLAGIRSVVTKADYVLALTGVRGDMMRTLRTLKARDGSIVQAALRFNPETFSFAPYESKPDF